MPPSSTRAIYILMEELTSFLSAVLGPQGHDIMSAAMRKSDDLRQYVGVRTILSWVSLAAKYGYNGTLPGLPQVRFDLHKSELGYDGEIGSGTSTYQFRAADLPHVVAAVAISMGCQRPISNQNANDLVKLGSAIDKLVKAEVVVGLDSMEDSSSESSESSEHSESSESSEHSESSESSEHSESSESSEVSELDKAGTEPPGPHDAPKAPVKPLGFVSPKQTVARRPKKPSTRLTLSEAYNPCSVCGQAQVREDQFVGCACLAELAKSTESARTPDGIFIEFDPEVWGDSDICLLHDIVCDDKE